MVVFNVARIDRKFGSKQSIKLRFRENWESRSDELSR
jgi:hypothetical protein